MDKLGTEIEGVIEIEGVGVGIGGDGIDVGVGFDVGVKGGGRETIVVREVV